MRVNWSKVDIPKRQVAVNEFSAPHAIKVHEGGTTPSGRDYPARPWVWKTVEEFNFLESLTRKGFEGMAQEFGDAMIENIEAEVWEWNGVTFRRNGEVVSSPRNIVDTEELKNSYSLTIKDER